jgi:hypothetical protein
MSLVLSSENVLEYLVLQRLLHPQDRLLATVTALEYRNFNLVVRMTADNCLLVKQERLYAEHQGDRCGFWREQRIYDLFQHFPDLNDLRSLTSEVILFDPESFIIVLRYYGNHCNLSYFYADHQYRFFPTEIAMNLGRTLARVHRQTRGQFSYRSFLQDESSRLNLDIAKSPNFLQGLAQFDPSLFSKVSADGLNFWRLYQRDERLHQAVVTIVESYQPCCLIHGDLEFRNILVKIAGDNPQHFNADPEQAAVKLIDWEFFRWGDPAYDLAVVLSCYVGLWLDSLVVSKAIPIQTTLKLAAVPLEILQSSMAALVQSYLQEFPDILKHQPEFMRRVVQFTGLVLIKQIQSKMERLYAFDNRYICTLQVAKMLLCNPEQSFLELFGMTATDLAPQEGVLVC